MLKQFLREEGGNFAVIFGLSLFPLVGLLGAAFDYTQLSDTKARIQSAADVAMLAAAKDADSFNEFQTLSSQYMATNLPDVEVSVETRPGAKSVKVDIGSNYETSFLGLLGFDTLKMNVNLEIATNKFGSGNTTLRIREAKELLEAANITEKRMLSAVNKLPPRDQDRASRKIRQRFDELRHKIEAGSDATPIHLIK